MATKPSWAKDLDRGPVDQHPQGDLAVGADRYRGPLHPGEVEAEADVARLGPVDEDLTG